MLCVAYKAEKGDVMKIKADGIKKALSCTKTLNVVKCIQAMMEKHG